MTQGEHLRGEPAQGALSARMFTPEEASKSCVTIKFISIGSHGGKVVKQIIEASGPRVAFGCLNTDEPALNN